MYIDVYMYICFLFFVLLKLPKLIIYICLKNSAFVVFMSCVFFQTGLLFWNSQLLYCILNSKLIFKYLIGKTNLVHAKYGK